MRATTPLLRTIEDRAGTLSPAQRTLARHVLANHRDVAFSTVAEIARAARVSEATVVRFANAMGYAGYPGFQQEVRRIVRADLRGTDRLRLAVAPGADGAVARTAEAELANIATLRDTHDPAVLREAGTMLRRARRVLVAGARATAPLAFHFWFALDKLGLDAARSLSADSEATDRLGRMDERDCVVVIGFPRYLRTLVAMLGHAGRRGVRRIVVTDSPFSALRGEVALHAPALSASFTAFHAAPLILLNALIEEVAATDREAALRALDAFEATAEAAAYFQPA